jgi:hypothetical protein
LGVDCTACLVEARQRDAAAAAAAAAATAGPLAQAQHQAQQLASESELRLQYAMAVVRMVNGIADSSQRGRVAASVASLASVAGLPRILVDLRHEATHNELPSLAALRWVTQASNKRPRAASGCSSREASQFSMLAGRQLQHTLACSHNVAATWRPTAPALCACLPCLRRLAAQHGLAWLQGNYWQRQSDHVHASTEKIRGMVQASPAAAPAVPACLPACLPSSEQAA